MSSDIFSYLVGLLCWYLGCNRACCDSLANIHVGTSESGSIWGLVLVGSCSFSLIADVGG